MYWKLAIQNIRRSLRDYIIYFVTLNAFSCGFYHDKLFFIHGV